MITVFLFRDYYLLLPPYLGDYSASRPLQFQDDSQLGEEIWIARYP
jgi:hypothetical protein